MKILRAVIWVGLVLSCAVTLSAQNTNDINSFFNPANPSMSSTGPDFANALSASWVPTPSDTNHTPYRDSVNTFAQCNFAFYYQSSTGYYYPVSVGMAAKHYSGCFANILQIMTDDKSVMPPYEWVIRGNSWDYSLFSGLTVYFWQADSMCRIVDPQRPWNAAIRVTRLWNIGC